MQIRIITLPFDEITQGFPDEIIGEFCLNKKVHDLRAKFFVQGGKAYWSVMISYEVLLKGEETVREFDEIQRQLFERLKIWRKEQAEKEGFPVYLICNNAQLSQIVKSKCMTLESLKFIKGFGRKKIDKYGKQITELIKSFYEYKPHE